MPFNPLDPFVPSWYHDAFDSYDSVSDVQANTNTVIGEGYSVPDADGSRSSLVRQAAILNNSFDERALNESLSIIYNNSTTRLMASNHDNVNFFQWFGHMSDMTYISSTNECEFRIPWNRFVTAPSRDIFKRSQFYRKWISDEDILKNWHVFKWCLLLFIDRKIYSEYRLQITEQDVIIRFNYLDYWKRKNSPVYIYKLDTNYQDRILITNELCSNQWDWKIPVEYCNKGLSNHKHIIAAINKISDPKYRKDGLTGIEVLGDNLEFLSIEDGYIDLSKLSRFNKNYIKSEMTEWLSMSIIVPKYFHEYPVLLPTDVVHRPYQINVAPIVALRSDIPQRVKANVSEEVKQIYIDVDGKMFDPYDGWIEMIRPMVLSDAYKDPILDPLTELISELRAIRDTAVIVADSFEAFRAYVDSPDTSELNSYADQLHLDVVRMRNALRAFYDRRKSQWDLTFESIYDLQAKIAFEDIDVNGINSDWIDPNNWHYVTLWDVVSSLINIVQAFVSKYRYIEILHGMKRKYLMENPSNLLNKVRFQRPIDTSDIWTFEYDVELEVWRPYPLEVTRHFPDVYILTDPSNTSTVGRIFKSFIFYSDTINTRDMVVDMQSHSPDWSETISRYHKSRGAYSDLFIDKFYWLGIETLYRDIRMTNSRWELLEYVINNEAYLRYTKLFLDITDPYFKLGLATYLKSAQFEFPFDYAVEKFKEALEADWTNSKKVMSFELYLAEQWTPSYFDTFVKIMTEYDPEEKLVRRPPTTFDMRKVYPLLQTINNHILRSTDSVLFDLDEVMLRLVDEDYGLKINLIEELQKSIIDIRVHLNKLLGFINNLDLQIYSVHELVTIISMIDTHHQLLDKTIIKLNQVYDDVYSNNIYFTKREVMTQLESIVLSLPYKLSNIVQIMTSYDMHGFMLAVNDLRSQLSSVIINTDDNSLLGDVNQFRDAWPEEVKDKRNILFKSTSKLYSLYNPNKSYSNPEVHSFVRLVDKVQVDLIEFRKSIERFWLLNNLNHDQTIINKLDHTDTMIRDFKTNLNRYYLARQDLVDSLQRISELIQLFDEQRFGRSEKIFYKIIVDHSKVMLSSVSYLAGIQKIAEAQESFIAIRRTIENWFTFLLTEEDVFRVLLSIVKIPSTYITVMEDKRTLLESLIGYLEKVIEPYIPDTDVPTYSEVFNTTSVEIVSLGFNYNEGELVYIPSLGVYEVTSVRGDLNNVIGVALKDYRNTSLRNPMIQSSPYMGTSDHDGMGLIVKPLTYNRVPIIDDNVIKELYWRIRNTITSINVFKLSPNPFNNAEYKVLMRTINHIERDWTRLINVYSDYMSTDVKIAISRAVKHLSNLIEPSEQFMEIRADIDIQKLLSDFDILMDNFTSYVELNDLDVNDYRIHNTEIRAVYDNFVTFVGNGRTWHSRTRLLELLNNTKAILSHYDRIVSTWIDLSVVDEYLAKVDVFESCIISILDKVDLLLPKVDEISALTTFVNSALFTIDVATLYKNKWYRITKANPGASGQGYIQGDIIAMVPAPQMVRPGDGLEQTASGISVTPNAIHHSGGSVEVTVSFMNTQDILPLQDTLLFQVMEVGPGGAVTSIQPLMDYALPYLLWGLRNTVTKTGVGYGLTLDLFSSEISYKDSTLLPDTIKPEIIKRFSDSDLFAFKFENIHDLNMNYEVFIAGKQISQFHQRHEDSDDHNTPRRLDVIYINANDIDGLRDSTIFIPSEQYFIYRLDNIEVSDPGAGYCEGQELFIDVGEFALRLRVGKTLNTPFGEIKEINIHDGILVYEKTNPTCAEAHAIKDDFSNIDDEFSHSDYDEIPREGIYKPLTFSYPEDTYNFLSERYDTRDNGNRNNIFMHPPIMRTSLPIGDPDGGWILGSEVPGIPYWNRLRNLVSPLHPMIEDSTRLPVIQHMLSDFQLFDWMRFHRTEMSNIVSGDLTVETFKDLPRHVVDWPDARIGNTVIVTSDETNGNRRMKYRIRSFYVTGYLVYNLPTPADIERNSITVDWLNTDWFYDMPTDKQQYSGDHWREFPTHRSIEEGITDGVLQTTTPIPVKFKTSKFIKDISLDDLSVYNVTTKKWENLHDTTRWQLETYSDPTNSHWGFRLTFLPTEYFSYDMKLYWNKFPTNQLRNFALVKRATFNVDAVIIDEVSNPSMNVPIDLGRIVRIRKLFPYKQVERVTIGTDSDGVSLGNDIEFRLAPYMHYKNQIHLQDVKLYNVTAGRFENILDPNMFEVRFKDSKSYARGVVEQHTRIVRSIISDAGEGFTDGQLWGYNAEYNTHIFGTITASLDEYCPMLTFQPTHFVNPPKENTIVEFAVVQHDLQTRSHMGVILVEFKTETVEVWNNGYIHNVINPLAPVPEFFKIIPKYELDIPYEYKVSIDKTPYTWEFVEDRWIMTPSFTISGHSVPQSRLYIMTEKGRFPLRNPSTGYPTMRVRETSEGTVVTFLNIYRKLERIQIRSTPYPMRSVYVQRRIPKHGYIDLKGKLNKPLSKKYFEFWVNGRLLDDEVTIITPTKIVMHGLKSLRNFEIIEICRDSNEYFSDSFIDLGSTTIGRDIQKWDYTTYLDKVLEGELDGKNFSLDEQAKLLSPIWPQVDFDHPDYAKYPHNTDTERDIIMRIHTANDLPIPDLDDQSYQFLMHDLPTLESTIIAGRLQFDQFGFQPISDQELVDMLNEEWEEEIRTHPVLKKHVVISDNEWYGMLARMYDSEGNPTNNLAEVLYRVEHPDVININTSRRRAKIIKNKKPIYDLE